MALREQADAGAPLVAVNPDDPASQAVRQAARGLIAMTPVSLPLLGVTQVGGPLPTGPAPSGAALPMAG
jgi:ATP-binding protein involved in chromosome partitioning